MIEQQPLPPATDGIPDSSGGSTAASLLARYGLAGGLVILAVTAALGVGKRGLWLDEAFTWSIVAQPDTESFIDALDLTASNMFGYLTLIRVTLGIGDSATLLRLPSVLFALATVWIVWAITARIADRYAAGIAAVIAGTSVPLTFYGLEARSYAMLACFSALSWYALLRALDDDRARWWGLLGVSTFLAVSAHVIALMALPSVGLALLFRHRIDKAIVRLLPVAGAALIGLAGVAWSQERDAAGFPPPLSPSVVVRSARLLFGDHGVLTREPSGFILLLLTAAILAGAAWHQWRTRAEQATERWILWIWLLGPPLTITVVSVVEPLLWHRMLIGSLPATFIIMAIFLAEQRRVMLVSAAVAVLVVAGVVRTQMIADADLFEYEDLATELQRRTEPGDVLSFTQPWERVGIDYYFRDELDRFVASPPMGPVLDYGTIADNAALLTERVAGDRIWLIDAADPAPVWKGDVPPPEEFVFDEAVALLPDSAVLVDEFDLGRFHAELWVVN